MLVLNRKEGESIVVDGPARIVVIQTTSGRIKLGIEADRDVKVLRGELLENMEGERNGENIHSDK